MLHFDEQVSTAKEDDWAILDRFLLLNEPMERFRSFCAVERTIDRLPVDQQEVMGEVTREEEDKVLSMELRQPARERRQLRRGKPLGKP